MKRRLPLPSNETKIRIRATTPEVNAWVAANAGSGKTSILRDRVIRLLLDGVPPDRILCLTFTRAAAAEMQTRIFDALAAWVAMPDKELSAEIDRLVGIETIETARRPRRLTRARRLFAEAVETPGGLKIQTIHGFAERILHLFPIEAKVPVDFSVLDDGDARVLRDIARRSALEEATSTPQSALGRAFTTLASTVGFESYARAIDEALHSLAALRHHGPILQDDPAAREAAYASLLDIDAAQTDVGLDNLFIGQLVEGQAARQKASMIRAISKTDTAIRLADIFDMLAEGKEVKRAVDAILNHCLTADESIKRLVDKAIETKLPELKTQADALAQAALEHLDRGRRLRTLQRSRALDRFASAVLDSYESAKRARNLLDYNDLIESLRAMLLAGQAGWVMMKLDAAIDHILVDEAQDTTPQMWDIVRALSDDFFAGAGQARHNRTIFVVGDEKQSIFSFQGAEPRVFDEVRQHFSQLIQGSSENAPQIDHVTKPVRLNYSFRSSDDILKAVDAVFAPPEHHAGLSSQPVPPEHIGAHDQFPGLVEVWPVVEPLAKPAAPADGNAPVDAPSPSHQSSRAAQQVATTIEQWLEKGERHLSDGTLVRPGDIIILAQQRDRFFRAVLRELKLRGVPVAGADRLKLQEEIVIHDLIVISASALLPEDDFSLAVALKTPVFGLDDAALARLCRHRPGALRNALAEAAVHDPALAAIHARLATLENLARTATPFAFFSDILIQPCPASPKVGQAAISGRQAFLTRLGPDAADAIDAFMVEAMAYVRKGPAFLLPFITMMRARDTDIKRDLDQAKGQVRVMTAHASKGLEARIVFVCDAMRVPSRGKENATLVADPEGNGLLLWAGVKAEEPEVMAERRAAQRRAQYEEYRRLLYVAMTRAEERLYIVGHRIGAAPKADAAPKERDPLEKSWHTLVSDGLAGRPELSAFPREDGETIRRWISPTEAAAPSAESAPATPTDNALPDWLLVPVREEATEAALQPSRARQGAGASAARDRRFGVVIHRLYECLPDIAPDQRAVIGARLIQQALPGVNQNEVSALLDAVLARLSMPQMQALFSPPSRAEVALAGNITLPNGRSYQVAGRIDRILARDAQIDLLDLKSGFPLKAVEDPAILRQMALYRALISLIYPGRMVIAHIFWTRTGQLETLPSDALDAALASITPE